MSGASPREQAIAARKSARTLVGLSTEARNAALHRVADALVAQSDEICAANQEDLATAQSLAAEGKMAPELIKRLSIDEARLESLADGIRTLADMGEPIGRVLAHRQLGEGLKLKQVT